MALHRHRLERLRSGLWFLPALIVAALAVLAVAMVELDTRPAAAQLAQHWPRLLGAGAEGARALLQTVAGSVLGVAGVSFSITVVVLSLASAQYTSRILRNFVRDRGNQAVLGGLLGVFVYCLLVLRTIGGNNGEPFVPRLATAGAVLLALAAVALFIVFIHRVATSIQSSAVIASAARETLDAVDQLHPQPIAEGDDDAEPAQPDEDAGSAGGSVFADDLGYLQDIDLDALERLALQHDLVLRLERTAGDFVSAGTLLARLDRPVDAGTAAAIAAAFRVGRHRTLVRDVAYGLRQIVDVALKGLATGISDITSATECIDHLGAIVARLGSRRLAAAQRLSGGRLRVAARGLAYDELVELAFGQIRHAGSGHAVVCLRLLDAIATAAGGAATQHRRAVLLEQLQRFEDAAQRMLQAPHERDAVLARCARLAQRIAHGGDAAPQAGGSAAR